jgi:hypothetical protein
MVRSLVSQPVTCDWQLTAESIVAPPILIVALYLDRSHPKGAGAVGGKRSRVSVSAD